MQRTLRAIRFGRECRQRTIEPAGRSMPSPSAPARRRCRWLPISSAAERPTGVSDICRNAVRRFNAASGISICRSRSPGASTLRWLPVTKSSDGDLLFAAVGLPDGADAIERGRQRDHRAGGQRHAEIAADGRGLPDLEGGQECAAALVDQRCRDPFRRAVRASSCATVQVAAIVRPIVVDRQRRPFEIGQIDQPRQMGLRFREQPGPAREPSIACRPNGQLRPRLRASDLGNGVQIHG